VIDLKRAIKQGGGDYILWLSSLAMKSDKQSNINSKRIQN
jgi:hypothetical protein